MRTCSVTSGRSCSRSSCDARLIPRARIVSAAAPVGAGEVAPLDFRFATPGVSSERPEFHHSALPIAHHCSVRLLRPRSHGLRPARASQHRGPTHRWKAVVHLPHEGRDPHMDNRRMTSLAGRRWVQRLRRLVTGVPFLVTAAVVVVLFAVLQHGVVPRQGADARQEHHEAHHRPDDDLPARPVVDQRLVRPVVRVGDLRPRPLGAAGPRRPEEECVELRPPAVVLPDRDEGPLPLLCGDPEARPRRAAAAASSLDARSKPWHRRLAATTHRLGPRSRLARTSGTNEA